jgi:uncharacterized protein (TIRG00374 family)
LIDRLAALPRRPVRLLIVIGCLVGLGWALGRLDPARAWQAASRAHAGWLALSAVPLAGRFLLWGVKWRHILSRREPVAYSVGLRILLAGSFVNLTTPTTKLAGGVVRAVLLNRRRGWPLLEAYGRAMADQVTSVLGHLLLYGLVAVPAGLALPPGSSRSTLLVSGTAVLGGVGLVVAMRDVGWRFSQRPGLTRLLARWVPERFRGDNTEEAYRRHLEHVLFPLLREGRRLTTFVPDLLWSAASFACICLANGMVLRAIGVQIDWLLVSAVVLLGYFAGIVFGIGGGIGITEAALTALYVNIGVPIEQALAGALLHRALLYGFVLLAGGLALLRESRSGPARIS